jgi:hypothetical protein
MKTEQLTEEELALVQRHREAKAREDAQRAAEEARKQKLLDLEEEFKAAVEDSRRQIKECLAQAATAIDKAVAISEQHGIPFRMDLDGMPKSRQYMPKSFNRKWKDLDHNLLYDYDFYRDDPGWEYWNSSSLSC